MAGAFAAFRRLVLVVVLGSIAAPGFIGAELRVAHAEGDCGPLCRSDPKPREPGPEVPRGEEGRFTGGAAVMTPAGEVVDSGAGASCADCVW
jgi:hypothetical protein